MPRTISDPDHARFVRLLRGYRLDAGLTQADLADRLGHAQTFVSKYELGQRRLDIVELSAVCDALGVDVGTVVARWKSGEDVPDDSG